MREFLGFSRESRESKKSIESIRSNHSIPSILSRAGIVTAALLVAVMAQAGSDSSQSAAFRVDTRPAANVRVTGVSSRWCDGPYGGAGRHVYFLAGVALPVAFTAQVEWGGATPARLEFNGANNGLGYAKTLDVGALGAGGRLEVVAVAADGTRSTAFRANFDVAPLPLASAFYPQALSLSSELKYTTAEFSMDVFKGQSGVVQGCPLPNETMEVQPSFSAKAEVTGNGTLTFSPSGGVNNGIKLNGTQTRRPDGKFGKAAGVDFGLNVEGEVVAVWSQTQSKWVVSEGYLGLNGYGNYSTAPYYVYAPPPIYLRAEIGADVSIGVRVKDLGDGQDWTPQFEAEATFPDIKGILGCGVGSVLALEGSVGVKGKFAVQSPPMVWTKLGVEGKIGAQIVMIGFATPPIDIWSGEYWIIGGTNPQGLASPFALAPEAAALSLTALDTRAFRPLGRDYLSRGGAMKLALAERPAARILALTGGTETTLVTDGYPYPEPTVVAAGATNHVLYVRDNAGRLAENRTELVDVHDGGEGWSAAAPVWDDGTGDFAPQAAALPDGTLLVAWANGRAALTNGASLGEALSGLEIAVGERNPVTGVWACRNLTANSYLDHSPALSAAVDGSAMAAWIRNRNQNPTGTPDEPNRILFSQRQGDAWSEEDYVAVNLGTITYLDLAYNGTQATLVFSMDGDGDLATQGDQELYGCAFNGSQWGPYVRLTSDGVQDTRPYVRYRPDGSLLVVWYRDGKIVSAKGLALADQAVAGEVGIGSAAQDFKLMTGPDGQLGVVWQDAGAKGVAAPDPHILNYDPDRGLWSHGVRLLEDPALERGFSATFGESGNLILAYSKVAVEEDTNGVPVFGAVDLCVLDHPVGSDPAIGAYGIALSTNAVDFGEDVQVRVTVENRGDLQVTNLAVCVYAGDPAAGGALLGETQRVAQVLGGTSEVVTVTWTIPEALSNVVLHAVADPGLETDDRNRANNTATLAALMPDLSVEGASAMNETTHVRLLSASVMNEGAVPVAEGTQVTFRRGAPEGELLAADTLGALVFGTNGVYDAGFRWDMSGTVFTSAFEVVYIAVDPTNGVDEIEEANNTAAVQVMTSLDSDGDGLLDGEEQRLGTRSDLTDTDGDGLGDFAEVNTHGTNPLLRDSDGDGAEDANELAAGTDPNSATDVFKIVAADGTDAYVMNVTWNAKAGSVYQVEAAASLAGPWENAPDNGGEFGASRQTAVTNGVLQYRDSQTGQTTRFYRVRKVAP